MAGIRQHILPRFLLKGFASRIQGKKTFTRVYRKGGPYFETTIENVGLEKHFYGKPGEVSADDEITQLEGGFAHLINDLRDYSNGTEVDGKSVSNFVAHLSIRTKQLREFFRNSADYLLDQIMLYLADQTNFKRLVLSKPELISLELQKSLENIPVDQAYKDFLIEFVQLNADEIIDQQLPDLQRGIAELVIQMRSLLPNAVKDGHIKSLASHPVPETRVEKYQSLAWSVRDSVDPLILSDTGCLFEIASERRFKPYDDKDDKILNVYLPIASRKLLLGTSVALPNLDFGVVSQATAKCSYEYFVTSERSDANEALSNSIGDWAGILSKSEMELLLKDILADLDRAPLDK